MLPTWPRGTAEGPIAVVRSTRRPERERRPRIVAETRSLTASAPARRCAAVSVAAEMDHVSLPSLAVTWSQDTQASVVTAHRPFSVRLPARAPAHALRALGAAEPSGSSAARAIRRMPLILPPQMLPYNRTLTLAYGTAYRSPMYVLASDGQPARSVGPWSKEKLQVVGNYMGIFTGSMKTKWKGLTYVDLFAGPGKCVVEGTGEELRGSPLLALDTKKPFDVVLCVEQDAEAREALTQRIQRHPRGRSAEVLPGDCNAIITRVIGKIPADYLSLVFIDPEGVSGLEADTMTALASRRLFVDLIILFPQQMSVNRNRWQWIGAVEDTPLDRVLGRRDWRTTMTPEVVQFMDLLRSLGFIFVAGAGRAFRNTRGAQLYYLVFASKSLTAATFWEKISGDDEQPTLF
ncbi:MAG: hypothetical protein DMF89_17650 [Acidobacteria bacterium]|nr:MAG: hypothetical protein DMF89_17650 [Acidobacteriota bacterium]